MQSERNCEESQLNVQNDFWFTIIENCENSLAQLQREISERRRRINKLETGFTAYLTYNMTKLYRSNPEADILELYKVEELEHLKPCTCQEIVPRLPDLNAISVFTMQGNDLSLMKFVKHLAKEEQELVGNIARLRKKEMALNEAHREVKAMLSNADKSNTKAVDEELLVDTNQRLLCENARLKDELNCARCCIMEQMTDTQMTLIKTIAEQIELNERLEKELADFSNKTQAGTCVGQLGEQLYAKRARLQDELEINKELQFEIKQSLEAYEVERSAFVAKMLSENGSDCKC